MAQPAGISIGPTVGIIQYGVQLRDDFPPSYNMKSIPGISFGLDIAYTKKRLLLNGQLLSSAFIYQVTNTLQLTANQQIPYQIKTRVYYYSLPLTLAYQVIRRPRFQVYTGLGIRPELSGVFRTKSTDINSGYTSYLSTEAPFQNFIVGSHLEIMARYPVTKCWIFQLKPTLHYYPKVDILFVQRNNVVLGITFGAFLKLRGS